MMGQSIEGTNYCSNRSNISMNFWVWTHEQFTRMSEATMLLYTLLVLQLLPVMNTFTLM